MTDNDMNKDTPKNTGGDRTEELETKLALIEKENNELKERLNELDNNWKRALADYRNFQKRVEEEKQSFVDFATLSLLLRVLATLDNLELLNRHINDEGLKMIIKELNQVFADEGLEEISALGADFDTLSMEAVELVEGDKNKVAEVLQKGYFLKGKLVRPARVKVGKGRDSN